MDSTNAISRTICGEERVLHVHFYAEAKSSVSGRGVRSFNSPIAGKSALSDPAKAQTLEVQMDAA